MQGVCVVASRMSDLGPATRNCIHRTTIRCSRSGCPSPPYRAYCHRVCKPKLQVSAGGSDHRQTRLPAASSFGTATPDRAAPCALGLRVGRSHLQHKVLVASLDGCNARFCVRHFRPPGATCSKSAPVRIMDAQGSIFTTEYTLSTHLMLGEIKLQ
eukprot:6490847-Amphidinium_carterae.4